jgi:hypothetical protein
MSFIVLERFAYTPFGTFGRLVYNDFRAFSVELPWADNKPRVSCIPEGKYTVKWYDSPTFGKTLAVIGDTVSLFPNNTHQRSAILFHKANTMDDLLGCIGLGKSLGYINGKWAVTSSTPAITEFLNLKIPDNTTLFIKQFLIS